MAAFTALAIGGLALSAYGQWKAGRAAKAAGEAGQRASESEAQLAEYNASVVDLQATDALERGQEEESRFRASVRGLIGSQRAGFAAGNVDVGFGSAREVQQDARFLGELDALTIKKNAAREAAGYTTQGVDLRMRAKILRQEGEMHKAAGREQATAANIGAASTLLTGGASLAEQRYSGTRVRTR